MLRKIFLPIIYLLLAYGFWLSPDFKEIAAGVAIFLFGMISMEEGFRVFSGGILEKILRHTTNRTWKSLGFGIVSTTIMQSSSLVSVITISFVSAGLLGLQEGIGIIFGANLGTTTGAWLVAGLGLKVKISAYAMPMLVFGIIGIFQSTKAGRGLGYILVGLGLLFLGIHYMKEGFETFKSAFDLARFAVGGWQGLLLFTGIGILATVVMQSSHATLVLIITALAAGQITYENALALAIGANIGTTITAIIGSLTANAAGKRLAMAHLIFNILTGLLAILLMSQLIFMVDKTSALVGIAADNYTLKLAVFHTLFNLLGLMVMLPWLRFLVTFLESRLKDQKHALATPHYLHQANRTIPVAFLESIRMEIIHLYDNAVSISIQALNFTPQDFKDPMDACDLAKIRRQVVATDMDQYYEQRIKGLYGTIIEFSSTPDFIMSAQMSSRLFDQRIACRRVVEAVKDVKHMRKNLVRYADGDNLAIRDEYDKIRGQMLDLFRSLHEIRQEAATQNDALTVLSLDTLRVRIEESDVLANDVLDSLIREKRITDTMATSLMNDSAYAYDIAKRLIQVAETVFLPFNEERLREAEQAISLSDDELEAVMDHGGKPTQ
ncbi:Na+/Pi-cotransporter [Magnetococcus marinus MC-1]|uniref:Na+/Pi-cotransporter n=1 Tax=Magnetococcus marinus (strain ATCC BAA-1437 / JCM 17883 / MC-1) TaxID=156889 RepID=A0L460_MAGMM|nr:Na/Pi symporter [Magnetococcus marinus]ABK42753.1 Na+/Pi-cotransporter [Magnetococcus marinus MC-1]